MQMTIAENIKKVFNGGDSSPLVHLNTKQADAFIDFIKDESVLLSRVRTKKMNTPQETIAKIGIGDKVLYPAGHSTNPKETTATPDSLLLSVKKFRGKVMISDDELEDNIEGKSFKEHLMRMIAARSRNQIETALIYGRFIGADPSIANVVDINNQWSGILEQAGVVVDAANSALFADRFIDKIKLTKLRKSFKTQYRDGMETFLPDAIIQDYIDTYAALAGWNTLDQNGVFGKRFNTVWNMKEDSIFVPLGGASTTTAAAITKGATTITVASASGLIAGKEIVVNYGLPTEYNTTIVSVNSVVLTVADASPYDIASGASVNEAVSNGAETIMMNPKNVIRGILRDITVEYERDASIESNNFYISIRSDVKVENSEALGFIKNLQVR